MLIKAGEIINKSWELYLRSFKKLLPYIFYIFLPSFVMGMAAIASLYLDRYATSGIFMLTNNIISLIILVACVLFTLWASMALAKNLGFLTNNQPDIKFKEALTSTSALIWPVIYTSLLVAVIVLGGTLLLIIPGIIFSVWLCFVYLVVVFEGKRGVEALSVSKKMVVGRWWGIFWRLAAPALFYAVFLVVASSLMSRLAYWLLKDSLAFLITNGLLSSALSALVAPLTALVTVILYFSAKENPVVVAPTIDGENKN